MNVLDLFSGIGGFSLGLERAGMRTVAFCEIDPFCQRVLADRWPGVPITDDIAGRRFVEGEADVVCGGFPCQDISDAGKRAGITGDRSGLWRELLRAIRLVRPRYAIVENVAALLGRGMGTVLGDLAESGHDAELDCIPAAVVGSRQLRDRVFIVATPGAVEHAECPPPRRLCGDEEIRRRASVSRIRSIFDGTSWATEPDVDRVAYGIPNGAYRRSILGNAVVPQIPEIIGRAIMSAIREAN
jgi:DNA (cytosine-5)-methyltransferase 1